MWGQGGSYVGSMTPTLPHNITPITHITFPLSSSSSFLSTRSQLFKQKLGSSTNSNRKPESRNMALQAPIRPPLTTSGNAGMHRLLGLLALKSSSFFSPSLNFLIRHKISSSSTPCAAAPKFSMRLANRQAYICRDCGYIYNDRTPFEKLPDNYFCPVCAAPKRRFRVYEPPVNKNANAADVRKARKADLQRGEALGRALPIAIAVGAVALIGLYLYLNSTF